MHALLDRAEAIGPIAVAVHNIGPNVRAPLLQTPDRLAAKGLPESMRAVAEQKTSEITRAYDVIKQARAA